MAENLRSDAAANRERLLSAARELYARSGPDVSLNEVARHAGVGVGTAYRRFANKQELMEALFVSAVDELEAYARAALDEPDAWRGIVCFLERSMELQFGDSGLNTIMSHPALADEQVAQARSRVAPLLQRLVERAREQGSVRADLEQSDIIFLQAGLAAIRNLTRSVEPDLFRRYLTVFLDGIRADPARTPLPVRALDSARTHAAMTQERRRPQERQRPREHGRR